MNLFSRIKVTYRYNSKVDDKVTRDLSKSLSINLSTVENNEHYVISDHVSKWTNVTITNELVTQMKVTRIFMFIKM